MGAAHYPRIVIVTLLDHVRNDLDTAVVKRIDFALERSAKIAPFARVAGVPLDLEDAVALLAKTEDTPMFGHASREYDEAVEALTFILRS